MPQPKQQKQEQIKELIELNDELENYFSNTIIPQLFVDANLILRKYTPPAMKQFRLSRDHIGKPMKELTNNIRYSNILDNIQEVIERGDILEKEIQTTDLYWYQMNIIPYKIKKENRTNGVIITFVDITTRIRVLKDLERVNASHETFIYSVSHDLKAPLSNIEGLVKLLMKTSSELAEKYGADTRVQKMVSEMLDTSVKTMKNILNELSEITKVEGNFKEVEEKVNFEEILQEVKMTVQDQINESNARITTEIQEPEIVFSRKNLRSVLFNLLSNAVKYKSSGRVPEIHIKTEKENEFILVSVKDNGIGIAEEKKELIFMPYTRLATQVEGTGIGLYLVKKIVENEGGKIIVNSKPDEGSEFIVYLKTSKQ